MKGKIRPTDEVAVRELEARQIRLRVHILNLCTYSRRAALTLRGSENLLGASPPSQSRPEPWHALRHQFLPACPHARLPKAALFCAHTSLWSSPTLHQRSTGVLAPGSMRNKLHCWCERGLLSSDPVPSPPYLSHQEMKFQKGFIILTIVYQNLHFLVLLIAVQLPSCVRLFATPWTTTRRASLSLTISRSLPKFKFIASVMPSSCLFLWCLLFFLPSIFPSIRVFSNEVSVFIRWPKY